MATAWESMRFGWPAYIVPFLFVLSPTLLMEGPVWAVLLAAMTASLGVWIASLGLIGHFAGRIPSHLRPAFIAAGIGLMVPSSIGDWAIAANIGGVVLGAMSMVLVRAIRPESRI
jgi:TRAP-type uncharacterized transport system fused permease subunit